MLAVYGNENRSTTVSGVDNDFFEARDWGLGIGRVFSDAELKSGKQVCVIGATTRKELFRHQDPIGATIRLVIRMLEIEDRTVEEVRQATGWSATLIRVRAFRARQKLNKPFGKLRKEGKL
jgi:DNA-directed RNA polymerase specialized sigma24 family protein